MDWLADRCFPSLVTEWRAIVARAAEDARLIWRSGGLRTGYLDRVQVQMGRLTMVPDWFAAVQQAQRILRPGGLIGVVDFYVSRKYPPAGFRRHGWSTRTFWPAWFARDNVFLSADHVPFLHWRFTPVHFQEHRARLPYVPLLRVPYYTFVGRRAAGE